MTLSQTLFSFKGRINRAKYWTIHLREFDISCRYYYIFDWCSGY